jgi:hypothetical protein
VQWVSIIAPRQRRRLIGDAAAVNLRTLPIVVLNTIPHSGIIVPAESYEFLNYVSKKICGLAKPLIRARKIGLFAIFR